MMEIRIPCVYMMANFKIFMAGEDCSCFDSLFFILEGNPFHTSKISWYCILCFIQDILLGEDMHGPHLLS